MISRLACVLCAVLLLAATASALPRAHTAPRAVNNDIPKYETRWFKDQILDHFNAQDSRTFQQRYFVNSQWWDPKEGPIFFYTGNEGPLESFWENTGFVFDIAPKFNALVIFAEHRYYGQTMPFGQSSYDRDKIGFLSVEQALADYAHLLTFLKTQVFRCPDAAVIAFGGSYGGMLSGWFRMKYPHVVAGAIAASAPILMGSGLTPPLLYSKIVTQDYASCAQDVRAGFGMLLHEANSPGGLARITESFKLCSPLSGDMVDYLVEWAENSFISMSMMDYPYPTNFLAPLPAWPAKVACERMHAAPDPLTGLAQAANLFYNGTSGTLKCFNITEEFTPCADQTGCGSGIGGYSWDYQACSEIIYFMDYNNQTDMFPPRHWGQENHTAYCQKRWGITPRYGWLDEYFGGARGLPDASNIVFSNGLLDPWSGGGVLHNVSLARNVVAVVIPDGAHHLDLRSANKDDPEDVVIARQIEVTYIDKFIQLWKTD